ncbi:MAG: 4-hydroxy-tetrahydrodipicolinate synthase [Thioalkalivibrionaceae bacterium]
MFQGSMVALVTPMRDDETIDDAAIDALVDWHLASGTDAIVAVGTTGESATLDVGEHLAVIARVIERVARRIPVIAGTGANATREAIVLTREAAALGADAALLVTPYYNKPTQEGLYRHYRAVADAVDVPQILYNVPGRTAVDLLSETVGRLCNHPNIVGVKDATGQLPRLDEMRAVIAETLGSVDGFALISGDDATATAYQMAGGHGVISVTANVVPAEMHRLSLAARTGDRGVADELEARLSALHRDLFVEANPIPVKWALARMGRIEPTLRLPLTPLSSQYHARVEKALMRAGIELTA